MSAALQLPVLWAAHAASAPPQPQLLASAVDRIRRQPQNARPSPAEALEEASVTWAFYRKHTENLLRRYLYASTQVGRSPDLLGESVGRGWVSSRRVKTFEDALIFVLDVERCLRCLPGIERQLISRIILQEYTQAETAVLLGISTRTITTRLPQAIDRLTQNLVTCGLLVLPD